MKSKASQPCQQWNNCGTASSGRDKAHGVTEVSGKTWLRSQGPGTMVPFQQGALLRFIARGLESY